MLFLTAGKKSGKEKKNLLLWGWIIFHVSGYKNVFSSSPVNNVTVFDGLLAVFVVVGARVVYFVLILRHSHPVPCISSFL